MSSEADGKITVALLPTMNVVSGLLQDGELTHEQSVKVCTFKWKIHACKDTVSQSSQVVVFYLFPGSQMLHGGLCKNLSSSSRCPRAHC